MRNASTVKIERYVNNFRADGENNKRTEKKKHKENGTPPAEADGAIRETGSKRVAPARAPLNLGSVTQANGIGRHSSGFRRLLAEIHRQQPIRGRLVTCIAAMFLFPFL